MLYDDKIRKAIRNSEFHEELNELITITDKMRRFSSKIFLTIFISILAFACSTYIHKYLDRHQKDMSHIDMQQYEFMDLFFWIGTLMILIFGILLIYGFNKVKKKGMLVYDELTDELDWSNKRKEYMRRPPIETRIVIKDFLQNTDLPFTSGANGQVFYVMFFFLLLLATIIVKAM